MPWTFSLSSVGGRARRPDTRRRAAAVAMLQAARHAAPKRRSVLQEALDNEGSLTYHRIREES